MERYVKRLIRCGYSRERAKKLCTDIFVNLGVVDLDFFVQSVEADHGI